MTPSGSACQGSVPVTATITNNGTGPIAIGQVLPITVSWTGAATGSVNTSYTVTTAIAPAGTQVVPVGTGNFSVAGTYNVVAHVDWTSDQNISNDTLKQSFDASAVNSYPYQFGFNGSMTGYTSVIIQPTTSSAPDNLQDGWTVQSEQAEPNIAPQEGSGLITMQCDLLFGDMLSRLYTPCFNIANACSELRFWYAQANGTSTTEGIRLFLSDNGGAYTAVNAKRVGSLSAGASTLYAQMSTVSGGIQWVQYAIDLSAYNGSVVKVAFEGFSGFGAIDLSLDNISLYQRPANDLGISAQPAPAPPPSCASAIAPVTVTIKNYGCDPQSNIPVQVVVTGPVSQTFNDVYTGTINPGATANITLGTMNTVPQGTYIFTGSTQMIGDGDATNDDFVYTLNVTVGNAPPAVTALANPANIIVGGTTVLSGTAPVDVVGGTFAYSGTTPLTIVDNTPAGIAPSITVSGMTQPANAVAKVKMDVRHIWRSDLTIYLIAPNGSKVQLIAGAGDDGDDFRNLELVSSGSSIDNLDAATYSGVNFGAQYTPHRPFAGLTGSANGTWQLQMADTVSLIGGTFNSWSIEWTNLVVSKQWTIATPPAPVAGFPYTGTSPGSRTLNTAGTYNFVYTATYGGGCGQSLPVTVNVFEGNQWLGVDNTNPNNNWQNPANWAVSPAPPAPGTAISIPAGTPFAPTIDAATVVGNLTIANGTTLTVNGSGSLTINGAIRGQSLASVVGIGPVTIGGTGTQRISGTAVLNSLTVNNTDATGLTFNPGGKLFIRPGGTLTMGANARITIPADGELTLMSDNTGTARLGVMPSSALITGELSLQRKLPASTGWYFASAPFKAATATIAEWDELPSRVAPVNNANVFEYTETNSAPVMDLVGDTVSTSGWRPPSARTNPINPADKPKGYRVYQNASLISRGSLLTVRGNPITQNVVTNFTFTPTAPGGYDGGGWNLLANPYASEIDWNAMKFDPTNAAAPSGNAFHVYNGVTKVYGSWTATGPGTGVAVNGASRYIASSQAIFIKATAAGSLTFKESHKNAGNPSTFLRTADPAGTLRFTFEQGQSKDEAAILFMDGASQGQDAYDAANLAGESLVDGASGQNLAINVLPALKQREVIPMGFKASAGQAQVRFEGISTFPTTARVYLRDLYLGTVTEVIEGSVYSFTVSGDPASKGNARFELVFEPEAGSAKVKAAATPTLSAWPVPASSKAGVLNVRVAQLGQGKGIITLTDVAGRQVSNLTATLEQSGSIHELDIKGLPAGVYTLKVSGSEASLTRQIVVE